MLEIWLIDQLSQPSHLCACAPLHRHGPALTLPQSVPGNPKQGCPRSHFRKRHHLKSCSPKLPLPFLSRYLFTMFPWHWPPNHESWYITWGEVLGERGQRQNKNFLIRDMEDSPNIHCTIRSPIGQVVFTHSEWSWKPTTHGSHFLELLFTFQKGDTGTWNQGWSSSELKSSVLQIKPAGCETETAVHRLLLRAGQHLKTLNWQSQSEIGGGGTISEERGAADSKFWLWPLFSATSRPLILFTNKTWYPGSVVAFLTKYKLSDFYCKYVQLGKTETK